LSHASKPKPNHHKTNYYQYHSSIDTSTLSNCQQDISLLCKKLAVDAESNEAMGEKKDPDDTGATAPSEGEEKVEEQGDSRPCILQQVMDASAADVVNCVRASLEVGIKKINPMPMYTRPLQRQAWGDIQVS
jgi:hypothetical protein